MIHRTRNAHLFSRVSVTNVVSALQFGSMSYQLRLSHRVPSVVTCTMCKSATNPGVCPKPELVILPPSASVAVSLEVNTLHLLQLLSLVRVL